MFQVRTLPPERMKGSAVQHDLCSVSLTVPSVHRLMDEDGSGAVSADELEIAFKVSCASLGVQQFYNCC